MRCNLPAHAVSACFSFPRRAVSTYGKRVDAQWF